MILFIGVGIKLGLPEFAALPLAIAGALLGYFTVYNRGWRKWLRKRGRKGPPKEISLGLSLGVIAGLTALVIVGMYFYYRPGSDQSLQLAGEDVFSCNAIRVIDGDTFDCLQGQRIRLHAVAARERDGTCSPGHPCPNTSAEAATNKLRELVGWGSMQCKQTGESYGRVVAICMNSSGVEINCAMIRSGTALRWQKYEEEEGPLCSGRYGRDA